MTFHTIQALGVMAFLVSILWLKRGDSARCSYCGEKRGHNDSCPNNYRL